MVRYRAQRYQEKPIYGIDYGKIVRDALAARMGIQQSERLDQQQAMQQQQMAQNVQRLGREGQETAEIRSLALQAQTDPQALYRLAALDPKRAEAIREQQQFVQSQEETERERQLEETKRFAKERAETAAVIRNRPLNEQLGYLNTRIQTLSNQGRNPQNTQGLYDMLASGDPNEITKANTVIDDAYKLGQIQEYLPPDSDVVKKQKLALAAGLKKGTEDYMSFMLGERRTPELSEMDKTIKRADQIKKWKDIGLSNQQIASVLKKSKNLEPGTLDVIAEMEAVKTPGGVIPVGDRFEPEQKLRKEYTAATEDFQKVQESYRKIKATESSPAGDIALVFNYMKTLDPGSVVREGEFATAQNAGSVSDKIINIYNRALQGTRLTKKQIADFKRQSANLYNASSKKEKEVRSKLTKVAKQYGLNPENIFFAEPVQAGAEERQDQAVQPLTAAELAQFE